MKKETKYSIKKYLYGLSFATVLALTSCGKNETVVESETVIENEINKGTVEENDIAYNKINEENADVIIDISATSEEELIEQLTYLEKDIPTMEYNIRGLVIDANFSKVGNKTEKLLQRVIYSCPGITSLTINRIKLTDNDFYFLSSLTDLTYLDLQMCEVENLSFLGELVNLKYLDLSINWKIDDISSLASLKCLQKLRLSWTNVSDLSVIKDLPSLNYLYISGTPANNYYSQELFKSREEIEQLVSTFADTGYRLVFIQEDEKK